MRKNLKNEPFKVKLLDDQKCDSVGGVGGRGGGEGKNSSNVKNLKTKICSTTVPDERAKSEQKDESKRNAAIQKSAYPSPPPLFNEAPLTTWT